MKSRVLLALFLGFFFFSGLPSFGEDNPGATPSPGAQAERPCFKKGGFFQQLNLSPEQMESLKRIREEQKNKMHSAVEDLQGKLKGYLTPEQQAKWDSISAEMRGKGRGKKRGFMRRAREELNLTSEQEEKFRSTFKNFRTGFKAIRDEGRSRIESILTPEQKSKIEQMKAERKGFRRNPRIETQT